MAMYRKAPGERRERAIRGAGVGVTVGLGVRVGFGIAAGVIGDGAGVGVGALVGVGAFVGSIGVGVGVRALVGVGVLVSSTGVGVGVGVGWIGVSIASTGVGVAIGDSGGDWKRKASPLPAKRSDVNKKDTKASGNRGKDELTSLHKAMANTFSVLIYNSFFSYYISKSSNWQVKSFSHRA
jgi:hypothetical protein